MFVFVDEAWCITTHVPNAKPDVLQAAAPGKYDFECDHGYWIEGGKSIAECVAGSWTLPECKRKCPYCKHDLHFINNPVVLLNKVFFILQESPTLVLLLPVFTMEWSQHLTAVCLRMGRRLNIFVQEDIGWMETKPTLVSKARGPLTLVVVRFSHTARVILACWVMWLSYFTYECILLNCN